MKPHILVTTTTLPRWENDPEPRFVLDLSRRLLDEFDVTILAPAAPGAKMDETLDGVPVSRYRYAPFRFMERLAYPGSITAILQKHPHYWPLAPALFLGLWAKMRHTLATRDIACVHAHWAIPQGFIQGAFFSRPQDPPYLLTSHGGDTYTAFRAAWKRRMIRRAIERSSAMTVVSRALEMTIRQEFGDALDGRPLHIAPMGASLERFHPGLRQPDWPAQHGLTRPLLLFVGRLAEKKGVTYLLHAMASPRIRQTSASLAVIGDGPLRAELEAEAAALNLTDRVRFLGSFDHRQLPAAYASADMFCAPFIIAKDGDREGLPTVLSEAGASGLPCVASDVGGVAEILMDRQTGLVVPQKDVAALIDALAALIDDEPARRRLGEEALRHVRQFGWDAIGARYAQILRQIIQEHSTRKSSPHSFVKQA